MRHFFMETTAKPKPKVALWRKIVFGLIVGYQILGIVTTIPNMGNPSLSWIPFSSWIAAIIIYFLFSVFMYYLLFKWTNKKIKIVE